MKRHLNHVGERPWLNEELQALERKNTWELIWFLYLLNY